MSSLNPTIRFGDRAEAYAKARPRYPKEIISVLNGSCGLTPEWTVMDIGSGTGILSQLFLDHGCRVFCVEPNEAMRKAGEASLSHYEHFISIEGTAEQTTLKDQTIDLIVAGQAFHWFDVSLFKHESQRILKPDGWVSLVWNTRNDMNNDFMKAYEEFLMEFGTDYNQVKHSPVEEHLRQFFGTSGYSITTLPNNQVLDHDGLVARVNSSSYMPGKDHKAYGQMLEGIQTLFNRFENNGVVEMEYQTVLYTGQPQK